MHKPNFIHDPTITMQSLWKFGCAITNMRNYPKKKLAEVHKLIQSNRN